ncbi:MAG: hypothetical protein FD163_2094 [Hyphomonadaceae bacterium]|nr:MAG: hypothetical protein FD128_680 [Hyphomonadaceae bacterium]KAF0183900.1 MAG: hypothetical protein FD163_2094 [Hyphomonadaceae bacterium]
MKIEFDPIKNEINVEKHGISLERAMDLEILRVVFDIRNEYGEERMLGFGLIDDKPHCICFTERKGTIRVISLRRAHEKEYKRYVKI